MKITSKDLGKKAKDVVTDFEGIIIGFSEWLTGCNTVGLKAKADKDGKIIDAYWFDEIRIEILDHTRVGVEIKVETIADPGGPQEIPGRGR